MLSITSGIPESTENPLAAELERPWEESQEELRKKLNQWKADATEKFDAAVLDWDKATAGRAVSLDFAINPEIAKKQGLVSSFLYIQNDGKDFVNPTERDMLRDGYAQTYFEGRGKGSDEAFLAEIQKDALSRKGERELLEGAGAESSKASLRTRIQEAALDGGDWKQSFLEWDREASKDSRYKPGKRFTYEEAAREEFEHLAEMIEEARPYAEEAMAGLLDEKERAGAYGGVGPLGAVMKAPPELQPFVMALVTREARKEGAKQAEGGHAWQTFGRGLTKQLILGPVKNLMAKEIIDAEKKLAEIKPGDEFGGRFDDEDAYASSRSADSSEMSITLWALEPFLSNNVATEEGIAKAKEVLELKKKAFNLSNELEQIAQGTLDPLKASSWFGKKVAYPFLSDVAPSMASGLIAKGVTGSSLGAVYTMWGMQAQDNAQQYLSQGQGISFEKAYEMGRRAAVYQSGIEYTEMMLSFGSGKLLGNALKAARASSLANLGKGVVTGLAAQNLLEGVQDVIPYVVQELDREAPGANAKQFFYGEDGQPGYFAQREDVFWALLPAVAIGAGGATIRARLSRSELERVAEVTKDQRMLKAAGLTEEARTDVMGTEDAAERLNKFTAALKKADPAVAKEGQAELEAERVRMEETVLEAQKSGVLPIVTGSRDEGYTITDGFSGKVVGTAKTSDEAFRISALHSEVLNDQNKYTVAYFASLLEGADLASAGKTQPQDKSTFAIAAGKALDEAEAVLLSPGAEAKIASQTALRERLNGGDGKTLWNILGLSITDMDGLARGVRDTVNHIRRGATVKDVIHEKTHGFRREAKARGRLTRSDEIEIVRQYDGVTRGKFTKGSKKYGMPSQSHAFLPEGIADEDITDEMLDEGISEIMEVEILQMARSSSRRKGGEDSTLAQGVGTSGRVTVTNLTAAIKRMAPESRTRMSGFIEAARAFFGLTFGRLAAIIKAERDGKFDRAKADEFISKLFGLDAQDDHTAEAEMHTEDILGGETLEGDPFSLGRSMAFSIGASPGFYSQLERTIEAKIPNSATPAQILATVDPSRGNGVKAEEIKWSGLEMTLHRLAAENGGKVPKQALLDQLRDEGSVEFIENVSASHSGEKQEARQAWVDADAIAVSMRMEAMDVLEAAKVPRVPLLNLVNSLTDGDDIEADIAIASRSAPDFDWQGFVDAEAAAREAKRRFESVRTTDPKYADYVLPGGQNYREVVLSMPEQGKIVYTPDNVVPVEPGSDPIAASPELFWYFRTPDNAFSIPKSRHATQEAAVEYIIYAKQPTASPLENFTSNHFKDVPNYLAHYRTDERTDVNGEPGLFIEELQSDRHQQGRSKGYRGEVPSDEDVRRFFDLKEDADPAIYRQEMMDHRDHRADAVPDAPFRKDWAIQLFKRALRDAVASGKAWIGWTTGETQRDRFDLSEQLDGIDAWLMDEERGLYDVNVTLKDGKMKKFTDYTADMLPDLIGKDMADKIVNDPVIGTDGVHLKGLDLKVGGEGMIGFYDKILPSEVGKYVKKWGGKVEKGRVETAAESEEVSDSLPDGHPMKHTGGAEAWVVEITDQMRDSVAQGQAAFSLGNAPLPGDGDAGESARDPGAGESSQGKSPGEGGSPSGVARQIARAARAGDTEQLGSGSEATVIAFGEKSVLKIIHPRGVMVYGPDGTFGFSPKIEDLALKAWAINILGGLHTEAYEVDGQLFLVQERGEQISLREFEEVRLPFGIVPSQGGAFYVEIGGERFVISDLHAYNFLKDADGKIRLSDLIASRVDESFSMLKDVNDSALSLAPAAMGDALIDHAGAGIKNPKIRVNIFREIMRRLSELRRETDVVKQAFGKDYVRKAIDDPRALASIRKERNFREADRRAELEDAVMGKWGALLTDDDLSKLKSQPIHGALSDPKSPLKGRLRSKSKFIKDQGDMFTTSADYDGSELASRTLFGGTLSPDEAAAELFEDGLIREPSPQAMWAALEREAQSVTTMKRHRAQAEEELRESRRTAKAEAAEWEKKRIKEERTNYSTKNRLLRAMAMLDGILGALPVELRGRVGGHKRLVELDSDEKRLEYLKGRIEKTEEVLEAYLRREFGKMMDKLLERAKPAKDKAGKKRVGKAGHTVHSLFDTVRAAMKWDGPTVLAHAEKLEKILAAGEIEEGGKTRPLTAEEVAHFTLEAGLVRLTGNWYDKFEPSENPDTGKVSYKKASDGADAERRAAAVEEATRVFEAGYATFRLEKLMEKEDHQLRRHSLRGDTGKAGTDKGRKAMEEDAKSRFGIAKEMLLSFFGFEQMAGWVFGDKSAEASRLVAMELAASNTKEDALQEAWNAIEELFIGLSGGRGKADAVFAQASLRGQKLRESLADVRQDVDGKGNAQEPVGIKASDGVHYSQLEGITITLMWRQADGRRHMIGHLDDNAQPVGPWHYDQAFVDSIEAGLSAEALMVRQFLVDRYAAEYGKLNPVFRKLNGINLPKNDQYSPLSVEPLKGADPVTTDPLSGTVSGSSFTPGSLLTRGTSIAQPKFRDALQVFEAHTMQIQHWMSYAEFTKEASALLNNRDVMNSVTEKAGPEAKKLLRGWVEYFGTGGTRDASAHLAVTAGLAAAMNRAAAAALVGRVSVLAVQATQLGAAIHSMPTGSYVKRMAKLLTGQLGWGDALSSPYIQRRLAQMPPVVRQAMAGLSSGKANQLKHQTQRIGKLIGGADALFTAGTYAMVYDYQLRVVAKSQGLTGTDAEAFAHERAEKETDRVAQPTRPGARSYFENTSTHPAMRLAWAFASESRQKLLLSVYALAKKPLDQKLRALTLTWVVGGLFASIIRAAMRDIRDDGEDDEVFDERNWDPALLIAQSLTSPLRGVPFLGEGIETGLFKAAGLYSPEGNLFSVGDRLASAAMNLPDTVTGNRDTGEVLRDVENILTGLGIFSGSASSGTSLMHIIRDLFGITQNVTD